VSRRGEETPVEIKRRGSLGWRLKGRQTKSKENFFYKGDNEFPDDWRREGLYNRYKKKKQYSEQAHPRMGVKKGTCKGGRKKDCREN